jgi:hypothetical protein
MTESRTIEPFETRLAGRIRSYTDPATERRIDALAVSRTAISSQRASGWPQRRLGTGSFGRRFGDARLAVALVAAILIGVAGVAVLGRLSSTSVGPQQTPTISPTPGPATPAVGPIPDELRHSWQRPSAILPGLDRWGTGALTLTSDSMGLGAEPDGAASTSGITAAGPETLTVTATAETLGCAIGDLGSYRWAIEGKGTVMTLTAIGADACSAREAALAGQWVRSDLPTPVSVDATLAPGTYMTTAFDPFDKPGAVGQLSYAVPQGWKVKDDLPTTFVLHRLASPGQPSADAFVVIFAGPQMAADFAKGATCDSSGEAPGVGHRVDDIVAAIRVRPGLVSTPPASVIVGGAPGKIVDLHLVPSWTRGCQAPDGPVIAMPILLASGSGPRPMVAIDPAHPLRLILLDLGDGRTMSVAISSFDPSQPAAFAAQVADVMPIVESFRFHASTP